MILLTERVVFEVFPAVMRRKRFLSYNIVSFNENWKRLSKLILPKFPHKAKSKDLENEARLIKLLIVLIASYDS